MRGVHRSGAGALDVFASPDCLQAAPMLLDPGRGNRRTWPHLPSIRADEIIVRLPPAHSAKVNLLDDSGWSPLRPTASLSASQPAPIPTLLSSGADINA